MIVVVAGGLVVAPQTGAASARQRFIVVFNDQVSDPQAVARDQAAQFRGRLRHVYERTIKGYTAEVTPEAAATIRRDPRVAYVEADQAVRATAVSTGVDRVEADKLPPAPSGRRGGIPNGIAIIDTGIGSHPDLNVVGGANCVSSFATTCQDGGFADDNSHGTHVAGIAAGRSGTGVAPGVKLYAVKVLDRNGDGFLSNVIAGIDWVTARASTIAVGNLSLGCECPSQAFNSALDRSADAGLVYTVAAGNDRRDAAGDSPANHPRVITVSAMADFDGKAGGAAGPTCRSDVDDTLADFSNFGPVVDMAAPGVCIVSTVPGGGYATLSGTSMASPHVAGAAALYIANNNVAPGPNRWSVVRSGLISSQSVPQSDPCGFTGGRSSEPMLMLAPCDRAGTGPPPTTTTTTSTTLAPTTTTSTTLAPTTTTSTTLAPTTTSTTVPPSTTTTTIRHRRG